MWKLWYFIPPNQVISFSYTWCRLCKWDSWCVNQFFCVFIMWSFGPVKSVGVRKFDVTLRHHGKWAHTAAWCILRFFLQETTFRLKVNCIYVEQVVVEGWSWSSVYGLGSGLRNVTLKVWLAMKHYLRASQFFSCAVCCEASHFILKFTTMFGTLALPASEVYF